MACRFCPCGRLARTSALSCPAPSTQSPLSSERGDTGTPRYRGARELGGKCWSCWALAFPPQPLPAPGSVGCCRLVHAPDALECRTGLAGGQLDADEDHVPVLPSHIEDLLQGMDPVQL